MKLYEIASPLSTQIASMVQHDQQERNAYQQFVQQQAGGDWDKGAQMYAQKMKRNPNDLFNERDNLNSLKQLMQNPNIQTLQPQDWKNIWLLVQHADFDRRFQQSMLPLIQQHLGQNSQEFKYLSDRISCGLSGTQKFNTQNICQKD